MVNYSLLGIKAADIKCYLDLQIKVSIGNSCTFYIDQPPKLPCFAPVLGPPLEFDMKPSAPKFCHFGKVNMYLAGNIKKYIVHRVT